MTRNPNHDYEDNRGKSSFHRRANLRICWDCRITGHSQTCRQCGKETQALSVKARVPRKDATKSKWVTFETMFRTLLEK